MSGPLRFAVGCLAGAGLAGTLALGWAWHRDRSRDWEEPRWDDAAFVPLGTGQREGPGGRATWIVAVNLRCGRCLTAVRRFHAVSARRADVRLVALVVDAPARPGADALRGLGPVPGWWDRDGIWRRRWGHRLYGELIQLDAAGRYVRTVDAMESLRDIDGLALEAPATDRKGGRKP